MKNCKRCNKEFEPQKGLVNYCSLECRNSRGPRSEEFKKTVSEKLTGNIPWNKGNKPIIVTSTCLHCGLDIFHRQWQHRQYHAECWKLNSGGYRKGSGIGKSGWYKGIWCDSSYELAWVVYNIDHNIKFKRNTKRFKYNWDGKIREYIPDFVVNNQLVEIKGYTNKQVEAKIAAVPGLIVLFKNDLTKEFEYVESKYGNEFTYLYDYNTMAGNGGPM